MVTKIHFVAYITSKCNKSSGREDQNHDNNDHMGQAFVKVWSFERVMKMVITVKQKCFLEQKKTFLF